MSRLLAAAVFLSLPLAVQAQRAVPPAIDKGSKVLAGGASISRSTTTIENATSSGEQESTTTSLSFFPSLLFFVAPRIAVGGEVALGYTDGDDASATQVGIGPAARIYLGGSETALPFLGASVRLDRTSYDVDEGGVSSANGWAGEVTAGITWLLSRQVGITGEGYVTRRNLSFEAPGSVSDVDQTFTSFGLRFGVAAFLPRAR